MRRSSATIGFALATTLIAAACVTVNVYFPVQEVREAAEEIVDETWGGSVAAESGFAALLASSVLEPDPRVGPS